MTPPTKFRGGPCLLDLFCGAGGCAKGYQRAGFYVVGVDIADQPRYCGDEFIRADALEVLSNLLSERADDLKPADGLVVANRNEDRIRDGVGAPSVRIGSLDVEMDEHFAHDCAPFVDAIESTKPALRVKHFDAIHASPPCQDYSRAMRHLSDPQPRLIEPVRGFLDQTGLPWIIENVEGAPLPRQATIDGCYGVELCGTSFDLRVWRHRLFETSFPVEYIGCVHRRHAMNPHSVAGRERIYEEFGRSDPEVIWRKEMGVDWMTRYEAREAIPPRMTEWIGGQLLRHLEAKAAA